MLKTESFGSSQDLCDFINANGITEIVSIVFEEHTDFYVFYYENDDE